MKLTDSETHARKLHNFVNKFKGYWIMTINQGRSTIWFRDMESVDHPKDIGWYARRWTAAGHEVLSGRFRTLEEAMLWVNQRGKKR